MKKAVSWGWLTACRRVRGVLQGRACKGVAAWGVPGGGAPSDAGEVFKKFVKKSMKNLQFFQNFQENFANFLKFFEI